MIDTRRKSEQGFTLVELSIVLVIIGLIVGGILVGQDMINAAKARSVVSQIEKYNTAVNIFQEKYGKLPGDYDKAVVNLDAAPLHNGNGDGTIGEGLDLPVGTAPSIERTEYPYFFEHLSKANLIDGSFDGIEAAVTTGSNFPIPKTGVGGILAYTDGSNVKRWFIGLKDSAGPNFDFGAAAIAGEGALKTTEAFSIDTKMDDGKANKGIVIAQDSPNVITVGATLLSECVNADNGPDYDLQKLGNNCRLNIRMN